MSEVNSSADERRWEGVEVKKKEDIKLANPAQ